MFNNSKVSQIPNVKMFWEKINVIVSLSQPIFIESKHSASNRIRCLLHSKRKTDEIYSLKKVDLRK